MPWGIVTNKPHALTEPLLARLGLAERPACVVSGDRLPQKKPHPAPLLLAAAELGVTSAECVYVGDAPRDIEAGRAAGMLTVAAGYGYISPGVDLDAWGADGVIRRPDELIAAIARLSQRPAGPGPAGPAPIVVPSPAHDSDETHTRALTGHRGKERRADRRVQAHRERQT